MTRLLDRRRLLTTIVEAAQHNLWVHHNERTPEANAFRAELMAACDANNDEIERINRVLRLRYAHHA